MKFPFFLSLLIGYGSLYAQSVNVIPYPREVNMERDQIVLNGTPNISVIDDRLIPLSQLLADDLFKLSGLKIGHNAQGIGEIVLLMDRSVPQNEYQISITDRILVKGSNYQTVAQGVTTLIQLHSMSGGNLTFPKLTIRDSPANEFRSLLIDVARQVINIRTLKQSVELCRFYKIPYLQIHIADDQAFCFPSTYYPELATKGHSYSLEELKDLVSYAKKRGVAIIPELDGPGHSTAIRAANPIVFGSTGFSALDLVSDTLYKGMGILLREMLSVFYTSPWFHIGADEANLNKNFLNAPHVKAFMDATGYSADDLQRMYVLKMDSIVKRLGKKTMAWESFKADNIVEKIKIPTDILVNAWETLYELPQNYVKNGFNIINTSWKPYYTTRDKRWHPGFIYNFSKFSFANFWSNAPSYVPFDINPTPQVKGGQMCVWEQLDAQCVQGVRNRIPAFSEYYWLEDKRPGYADYEKRFRKTDLLFEKLLTACKIEISGTNLVPSVPVEWHGQRLPNPNGVENNYQNWFEKEAILKITPVSPGAVIYYTTDGTDPDTASKVLNGTLTIRNDTYFRMITYLDGIIGYQQYLFEHRPVRAILEGSGKAGRDPEPYTYNSRYAVPLIIRFEAIDEPGVEIRYTTDGTQPDSNSLLYAGSVVLATAGETTVRACAFKEGQPYGKEWSPSDFFEYKKNQAPSRFYRFTLVNPD